MRKTVRRGATALAALALVFTLAPAAAMAGEGKRGKLKVCVENDTPAPGIELDTVFDGASFRSKTLGDGECKKWKVRQGQYKATLDDIEDLQAVDPATLCPAGQQLRNRVEVRRGGQDYDASLDFLDDGSFLTNVRTGKKTTVTYSGTCVPS